MREEKQRRQWQDPQNSELGVFLLTSAAEKIELAIIHVHPVSLPLQRYPTQVRNCPPVWLARRGNGGAVACGRQSNCQERGDASERPPVRWHRRSDDRTSTDLCNTDKYVLVKKLAPETPPTGRDRTAADFWVLCMATVGCCP
eukprot:98352-Rhodomonas_salina.3